MTKEDLVKAVAQSAGLTQKDAHAAVTATFESIEKALSKGDKVALVGFGTFQVKERAGRTGRNPRTGAEIQIAATKAPAFSAGKGLKDAVK